MKKLLQRLIKFATAIADDSINVWLDDTREAPAGWVRTKTVQETIDLLKGGKVKEISLDHDLGEFVKSQQNDVKELTGYDVVLWMAEHNVWPEIVRVHSQNPVGREKMQQTIQHYAPVGTLRLN